MMNDKTKRKSNPRRRLLLQIVIGIGLIVTLVSVGIYALRPTGAQIVFIAPDNEGIEQIWLADLNDPEYPRQLTNLEQSGMYYQISENSEVALILRPSIAILVDLTTGHAEQLELPDATGDINDYELHPNGQWIAYAVREIEADDYRFFRVMVYDIQTHENHFVTEYHPYTRDYFERPFAGWVGHTDLLAFNVGAAADIGGEVGVYRMTDHQLLDEQNLYTNHAQYNDTGTIFRAANLLFWASEPIEFRNITNPETLLSAASNDGHILDWHPDNEHALILEKSAFNSDDPFYSLIIHNIVTGAQQIIRHGENDNMIYGADFNIDGSKIVYAHHTPITNWTQIYQYDVETDMTIGLPLFGSSPQWINGRR